MPLDEKKVGFGYARATVVATAFAAAKDLKTVLG
jgi:hypothetical protein